MNKKQKYTQYFNEEYVWLFTSFGPILSNSLKLYDAVGILVSHNSPQINSVSRIFFQCNESIVIQELITESTKSIFFFIHDGIAEFCVVPDTNKNCSSDENVHDLKKCLQYLAINCGALIKLPLTVEVIQSKLDSYQVNNGGFQRLQFHRLYTDPQELKTALKAQQNEQPNRTN